ncbi:MAG TPA: DNA recombination protein RmuC [Rhizomicrobium sp.]|nr:DNA recombination protein RmuC [Rhizomicrobium sp.]
MEIALFALAAAVLAAALILAFARRPAPPEPPRPDPRLDTVIAAQGGISERFQQAIESQTALQKALSERMDVLNQRLNETLSASATKTAESLAGIQTRLSVIDEAQKNITQLSGQVVSLQEVLSNKQSRGAFGQAQMEEIVRDGLPPTLYEFQATLSNGNRPDCIIRLPNATGVIVIDSKFPLECFTALKSDADRKSAEARVRNDLAKHIKDISEKYLIPGEVQRPAIMFVPSESIYAELHDGFVDVIQRAHRAGVMVVSPNILMLAINTVQTVVKDAKMREQAHLIQQEVGVLLQDVQRLGERVEKLRSHFDAANKDIDQIETSMRKIENRGEAIAKVELSPPEAQKALARD